MNPMFAFDPKRYAPAFAEKGYVHVRGGLSAEYLALLKGQVDQFCRNPIAKFALGDKQQSLYEFPDEHGHGRLCEMVGKMCGLDPAELVVSERHIKAYEADADPNPMPHKDRYATQVAVGFSVHVPPGSTLVIYPHDHLSINPFNSWAEYKMSLSPEQAPANVLKSARPVEIHDEPGDVVLFRGNAMWHCRARPAGTTMLYFKINAWNCDPIGEDPLSDDCRAATLQTAGLADEELTRAVPLVGRKVDYFQRRFTRDWQEVPAAVLCGQGCVLLDEQDWRMLRAIDGRRTVATVLAESGGGCASIRRLAKQGVLDLRPQAAGAPATDKLLQVENAAGADAAAFLPQLV